MKEKKTILTIWVVVNLIILGKYVFDASTIQCEPCLPNQICPPCQTDYMVNTWWFLLVWNSFASITWILLRKNNE